MGKVMGREKAELLDDLDGSLGSSLIIDHASKEIIRNVD